jgi:hypothetical protein
MTVPFLTQEAMLELLKHGGCKIVSDAYWNDYDTLVLQKGDIIFTLYLEKRYFYPKVVTICHDLEIQPPEDHLRQFYQHFLPEEVCYCESKKLFKDCHGKQD